jgi:predicted nucleic acid-binding protein
MLIYSAGKANPQKRHFRASDLTSYAQSGHFFIKPSVPSLSPVLKTPPHPGHFSVPFKWHPEFAPRYVAMMRGSELVVSFMTLAEMRQGALEASWGRRKCDVLEAYLAGFSVLHSDSLLCSTWAAVRNESTGKGRQMGSADAWIAATALALSATASDEQSQGLPPPGQAPACFHSGLIAVR